MGRRTSSPLQFGQRCASEPSAQVTQKVHSNEQMRASGDSGGKSLSQHSQLGRSSSMIFLLKFPATIITVIVTLHQPMNRHQADKLGQSVFEAMQGKKTASV
ncbi:hypothetical protein AC790_03030 [Pantoea sp. RIT-PI-b]|nr:hypothetical protein AC790_03030 [Pantoea sp. RIT-PI-b]